MEQGLFCTLMFLVVACNRTWFQYFLHIVPLAVTTTSTHRSRTSSLHANKADHVRSISAFWKTYPYTFSRRLIYSDYSYKSVA